MRAERLDALSSRLERSLPTRVMKGVRKVSRSQRLRRLRHRPRWGNLRRLRPFSDNLGLDRGTPLDRVYLHDFFAHHAGDIRGHVLEVEWAEFAGPHGTGVTAIDVFDIDPRNDRATILGDLSDVGSLPPDRFDCAVVPQTLQYVSDVDAALDNLWQSLKPGGVVLLTMPSLSRIDPASGDLERWRMLPSGLRATLQHRFPGAEVEVRGYGNLVAASAFLLGLVAEELSPDEIDVVDPGFPVLACARVRRAGAGG